MIKAIIFDWGNVLELVDQKGFNKEISNKYSVELERFTGVEAKNRSKMDAGEIDTEEYLDNINKELGIEIDKEEYYDIFFSKYVRQNKKLIDIIRKLKKYKLFILSNNNPPFYRHMKEDTDFEDIFDKIVLSFKEGLKKPNREFYMKVLDGLKPEECLFVDDREGHAEAAEKLGMKTIVYDFVEQFEEEFSNLV